MAGADLESRAFPNAGRPGTVHLLQLGKEALASQPFNVFVGAELTCSAPGRAELTIPITPQLKRQHGLVHGGVIRYAADNALTAAGASVLSLAAVTSEYKTSYIRPAMGGCFDCKGKGYLLK